MGLSQYWQKCKIKNMAKFDLDWTEMNEEVASSELEDGENEFLSGVDLAQPIASSLGEERKMKMELEEPAEEP